MESRLRRQHRIPGPQGVHQGHQQPGNFFCFRAAHIENFDGAGPQNGLIVRIKGCGCDGGHLFGFTQPGHAEGISVAHDFQQLLHSVGPLVVQLRFDGGDEVLLLAFHKAVQESPFFQRGVQQHLLEKFQHRLQHPVAGEGEAVIHKAAENAGGLVVTHPPHQGGEGCAVQFIQIFGDGPQVRAAPGAPQQNGGQQRIAGRLLPPHMPHQLEAEAALLESAVPADPEGNAGQ